jgi:hypothetical protein
MNNNFKSASPLCVFGVRLVIGFGLFKDAGNLITNGSGLEPAAVG